MPETPPDHVVEQSKFANELARDVFKRWEPLRPERECDFMRLFGELLADGRLSNSDIATFTAVYAPESKRLSYDAVAEEITRTSNPHIKIDGNQLMKEHGRILDTLSSAAAARVDQELTSVLDHWLLTDK